MRLPQSTFEVDLRRTWENPRSHSEKLMRLCLHFAINPSVTLHANKQDWFDCVCVLKCGFNCTWRQLRLLWSTPDSITTKEHSSALRSSNFYPSHSKYLSSAPQVHLRPPVWTDLLTRSINQSISWLFNQPTSNQSISQSIINSVYTLTLLTAKQYLKLSVFIL